MKGVGCSMNTATCTSGISSSCEHTVQTAGSGGVRPTSCGSATSGERADAYLVEVQQVVVTDPAAVVVGPGGGDVVTQVVQLQLQRQTRRSVTALGTFHVKCFAKGTGCTDYDESTKILITPEYEITGQSLRANDRFPAVPVSL